MTDPVALAAITAGSTILASGIGALTTYKVQRRSTDVAIKTAEENARVELAKVEAENARLRQEHREVERQNRQGTYHRMLAVLDRFDSLATGYAPNSEQLEDALTEFNFLSGGIALFGADGVKRAMGPVQKLLGEAGAKMSPGDKVATFSAGYIPIRSKLNLAREALVEAMGKDIKAGILDD